VRKRTTGCLDYFAAGEDFPANNIPVTPLTQKLFLCQFATGPQKKTPVCFALCPLALPHDATACGVIWTEKREERPKNGQQPRTAKTKQGHPQSATRQRRAVASKQHTTTTT